MSCSLRMFEGSSQKDVKYKTGVMGDRGEARPESEDRP